jgi:hypothetical protein
LKSQDHPGEEGCEKDNRDRLDPNEVNLADDASQLQRRQACPETGGTQKDGHSAHALDLRQGRMPDGFQRASHHRHQEIAAASFRSELTFF